MVTKTIRKWAITVSVTRTLEYYVEEFEDKEEARAWANSREGKKFIQSDFIRHLNCYSYPRNADMEAVEVELKEYEVKSTDTDPRV